MGNEDSNVVCLCATEDLSSPEIVMTVAIVLPTRCTSEHLACSLRAAIAGKVPRATATLRKTGKLFSFAVPLKISPDTEFCRVTSSSTSCSIAEANIQLPPRAYNQDIPTFLPEHHLAQHFRGPGCPTSLKDFLAPGTPLLHVHISVYNDATLLGITTSHVAFDAHGLKVVLAAWAAASRGELPTVVASPISFFPLSIKEKENRAAPYLVPPRNEPRRGWYALGLLSAVYFVILYLWAMLKDRHEQRVFIRIPSRWIDEQKSAAMAELKERGDGEWLSRNDIICAWILWITHLHRRDSTPITPHMTINFRALLPDVFTHPYVHNAVGTVSSTPLPAAKIAAQSLLETALHLRRSLEAFKHDIPTLHAELLEDARHPGRTLFPARPGGQWVILTSWLSAAYGDLAFASAPGAAPVSPTWVMPFTQDRVPVPMRSVAAIVSETNDAVWVRWAMGSKEFGKMMNAARDSGESIDFIDIDYEG